MPQKNKNNGWILINQVKSEEKTSNKRGQEKTKENEKLIWIAPQEEIILGIGSSSIR